jgi:DNA-binding CsgD family transcriptional regulator
MIDAAEAFTAGQVYVALSRCTNLEGIVLLSQINANAIINNDTIKVGSKQMEFKGSLQSRFEAARVIFTQLLLENIFNFNQTANAANYLLQKLPEVQTNLTPNAQQVIQSVTAAITQIKNVADLFISKFLGYLKTNGIIETNEPLQQKLAAAYQYFNPLLNNALLNIKNHNITTEHKMAADVIDPLLTNLYNNLHQQAYLISYCQQPFTLANYLQHKINYKQQNSKLSIFAAGAVEAPVGNMPNIELYTQLKNWRNFTVLNSGLPTFRVATQESIQAIATYLPLTTNHLQQIKGFGKSKADAYGPEIIDLVYDYCTRYNLPTQMHLLATNAGKTKHSNNAPQNTSTNKPAKIPTQQITYNMYLAGTTIADIATQRGFSKSTIEGHLAEFVKTGQINITDLIDAAAIQTIEAVLNTSADANLTDIKAQLPPGFTFGHIRWVQAAQVFNANKK